MFGFGGYLEYVPCRFSWLDWISHGHLTKCEIQWAPSSCQRGWWGLKFGHMPRWLMFCWVRWWNPNQILWKKLTKKNPRVYTQAPFEIAQGVNKLENWGSLAHWHSHLAHLWRHAIPFLGLQWDTSASWPINSPIKQVSHHSETTQKMISLAKGYKKTEDHLQCCQAQNKNTQEVCTGKMGHQPCVWMVD